MRRSVLFMLVSGVAATLACSDRINQPVVGPAENALRNMAYCGEDACDPVTSEWPSYFETADCRGTEYYPTINGLGDTSARRSWDIGGVAGRVKRTATVRSHRSGGGLCSSLDPAQERSELVIIYREPTPDSPAPCEERICKPLATTPSYSYFPATGCTGNEHTTGDAPASWDAVGVSGTVVNKNYMYSYQWPDGWCRDIASPRQGLPWVPVRVYRTQPNPASAWPCAEQTCASVTQAGMSLFSDSGCVGQESGLSRWSTPQPGASWDGGGFYGKHIRTGVSFQSRRGTDGTCIDGLVYPSTFGYDASVRIYRITPPAPFMIGPWMIRRGETCTWSAVVSGGRPPYAYQWSGLYSSSTATVTGRVWISGFLYLTVTDADGRTGSTYRHIAASTWSGSFC